jgi:hypothetical protein
MDSRRPAAAPDDRMRRFEQEIEELARHLKGLPYVGYTQSELASDLKKVRDAADRALGALKPLRIVNGPEACNFPLFQTLLLGLNHKRMEKGLPLLSDTDFPASVVNALIELQEAAETALMTNGPKRGNAARRTSTQAYVERAAMAFVLRYRAIFGDWPPKSETGPSVEAMRTFLVHLGLKDDADAAGVLKRAVSKEREAEKEGERRPLDDAPR